MENVTMKIQKLGASYDIYLHSATAGDLALAVNLLFNWGIISEVPSGYVEGQDCYVMVQSDRKRFYRGLLTAAMTDKGLKVSQFRHKQFRCQAAACIAFVAHFVRNSVEWVGKPMIKPSELPADTEQFSDVNDSDLATV